MELERIDQVHEPMVGEFYLVPCVDGNYCGQRQNWPVIGPKHEDAEIIGFKHQHFHVDPRFVNDTLHKYLSSYYKSSRPLREPDWIFFSTPLHEPMRPHDDQRIFGPVVWRRRRMHRQYQQYPREKPGWLGRLEAVYEDHHLKENMVCPHRGAPLKGLPVDSEGCVTCPLHGLRWRVATGELVRGTVPETCPVMLSTPS